MTGPNPTPDRPVRVLLVDDDEDDYVLTREAVAAIPGGGYALDWASDFDTALQKICQGVHDVYLVDFQLGAQTGLDLLSAMREKGCPGPVILLTGLGGPEIDRAAEAAGAADFIEKGHLDPVLLERSIRYTLRQRATELDLERKVAERTADLERANAALRRAEKRKDEFLSTLAHELRNPLAPIRNALAILRLAADNPASAEKAWEMMDRQVRYLVRLIDDLLDATRMSRNTLRVDLQPLDLLATVRSALTACQAALDAAGLTVAAQLPADPVIVNGDPARLTQLFANLLSNAAKYTDAEGQVTVSAVPTDREVTVTVRDTGIGIPADALPYLFDLFERGPDRPEARAKDGLGIGLALARQVAEMHGGAVTAHSAGPGQGAEFTVRLPLHQPVSSGSPGSAS
jgi:signal transduction histidine kinase